MKGQRNPQSSVLHQLGWLRWRGVNIGDGSMLGHSVASLVEGLHSVDVAAGLVVAYDPSGAPLLNIELYINSESLYQSVVHYTAAGTLLTG